MAAAVKTRTVVQTRTHAQKYFQKVTKATGVGSGGYTSEDDLGFDSGRSTGGSTRRTSKRTRRTSDSGSRSRTNTGSSSVGGYSTHSAISDMYMSEEYDNFDTADHLTGSGHLTGTPTIPSSKMNIMVPHIPQDLPQPSPAACGKRKEAELTAAKMLLGPSSSFKERNDKEGAEVLSSLKGAPYRPGEIVRKQRANLPALSIINPVNLDATSSNEGAGPGTPWEKQVKALENKNSTNVLSVATPSQQKHFLTELRNHVMNGDVEKLVAVLKSAEGPDGSIYNSKPIPLSDMLDTTEVDEGVSFKEEGDPTYAANIKQEGSARKIAVGNPTGGQEKTEDGTHSATSMTTTEDMPSPVKVQKVSAESNIHSTSTSASASSSNAYAVASPSIISSTLNRLGSIDKTLLMDACSLDPTQHNEDVVLSLVKALLEYGASPTITSSIGFSCLHYAAERGYDRVGRLLLNRGCPVNAVTPEGNTSGHIAALNGHGRFLELLADFGANCHLRNNQALNALDLSGTVTDFSIQQREELRRIMLSVEPRLRTLVLYHEDCLEHSARRPDDWEGPDRLMGIMHRLQNNSEFPEHELEISTHFDKANVEMLSRVHSSEYIAFVDKLSKQMKADSSSKKKQKDGKFVIPFTPHVQNGMQEKNWDQTKAAEYCDTSFSEGTLHAARRAAGAVAHAVDRVLTGRNRNAFCCVRPPGHHAGYNGLLDNARSCGFCIFNSVASGAMHALEAHKCERVAIVDIDVHHGNGTEDIVRRYPHPSKLLFFSMHLYDKDIQEGFEFFPGSGAQDDSKHNIINVPILPLWYDKDSSDRLSSHGSSSTLQTNDADQNSTAGTNGSTNDPSINSAVNPNAPNLANFPGYPTGSPNTLTKSNNIPTTGREAYRQAVTQRLLPSLRAFNPALIILSTGFDSASGDVGNSRTGGGKEMGMDLHNEDFEWVTAEILKIADICCAGKVVSVLEGGYGAYTTGPKPMTKTRGNAKRSGGSPEVSHHLISTGHQ